MYFETKQNQKPNKSKKKEKQEQFVSHTHTWKYAASTKQMQVYLLYTRKMPNTIFICCHQKIWIQSLKYKNEKKLKKDDVDDDDDEEEDEEKKASICHDTVNLSIKHTHIFTYDVWERNNRIKTLFFLYVFVCLFFLKSATNPFRLSNKTF